MTIIYSHDKEVGFTVESGDELIFSLSGSSQTLVWTQSEYQALRLWRVSFDFGSGKEDPSLGILNNFQRLKDLMCRSRNLNRWKFSTFYIPFYRRDLDDTPVTFKIYSFVLNNPYVVKSRVKFLYSFT